MFDENRYNSIGIIEMPKEHHLGLITEPGETKPAHERLRQLPNS